MSAQTPDEGRPSESVDTAARPRSRRSPALGETGRPFVHAGPEALQRVIDGELPVSPGAQTLGIRLSSYSDGAVTMTATPGEWACNNGGTVHGGIISGWVDSALGYATASAVEAGVGYSTLDLTVRYLRSLRLENTPVTIRAEVEHCGRSTAVVQATVVDSTGRTCSSASGVMMLFRP